MIDPFALGLTSMRRIFYCRGDCKRSTIFLPSDRGHICSVCSSVLRPVTFLPRPTNPPKPEPHA